MPISGHTQELALALESLSLAIVAAYSGATIPQELKAALGRSYDVLGATAETERRESDHA